ncbi:MAG: hypothetical protein JJU20_10535 [Opitutales bacterium]|nr:hypothetical protein [Opitutales bacterium]
MRTDLLARLFCLLAAGSLCGCGTVQEHRARQYSVDFATERADFKAEAVAGELLLGMRPVSVYVALGTPEHAVRVDEDGFWWLYFGHSAPQDSSAAEDPERLQPRFLSRSELRMPARGEERERLKVWFEDDRLVRWERRPLRSEDLRLQRESQYGRIPVLE